MKLRDVLPILVAALVVTAGVGLAGHRSAHPSPAAQRFNQLPLAAALGRRSLAAPPRDTGAAFSIDGVRDAVHDAPISAVSGPVHVSGAGFALSGWAIDTTAKRQVRAVIALLDDGEAFRFIPDNVRDDVARAYGAPDAVRCGFFARVTPENPLRGPHAVTFRAELADGTEVALPAWITIVAGP